MTEALTPRDKRAMFSEHWSPRIVGAFNGHDLMAVNVKRQVVWHDHADTDDFFMVAKGVQHRPVADDEAHLLLIEPVGKPNTGDPATAAHTTSI